MIGLLRERIDAFLGRGAYSLAVPVMDGPLQPNERLDRADLVASAPGLDNLLSAGGRLLASSGHELLALQGDRFEHVESFASAITCLAHDGGEATAIGLSGAGITIRGGAHRGINLRTVSSEALGCATAALFVDRDTLIVANGSSAHRPEQWPYDLMSRGRSGSVWRISLRSGDAVRLAGGLAYPYGLALAADGRLLVSEAWRHRVVALDANRPSLPRSVLEDLPGYPARLALAEGGGFWLAVFAPRNQLVEFVLQERDYCRQMMASMEPQYWIAPALSSGNSFREPIQGGAIKTMGILKPWAPTRSYGLVVRLSADLLPRHSLHSRSGGRRHGVTSMCEHRGQLFVAAKGPGQALAVELGATKAAGGQR